MKEKAALGQRPPAPGQVPGQPPGQSPVPASGQAAGRETGRETGRGAGQAAGRRMRRLLLAIALGGLAWLSFVLFLLIPAWQAHQMALAREAANRRELALAAQRSRSLPGAEERLRQRREEILNREAALAGPGGETELLTRLEELAGDRVVITLVRAGAGVPVAGGAKDGARDGARSGTRAGAGSGAPVPYWRYPYRIDATGDWPELVHFLGQLEARTPGLRVEAVQLDQAGGPELAWRLVASCSLYVVMDPLGPEG